jgi:hypothetical protein
MCVWIDIVDLAKRGFFRGGLHRGEAELLSEEPSDWGLTAEIRTAMGQSDGVMSIDVDDPTRPVRGMLTLYWPHTTAIAVNRVDDHAGHKWYFGCPACERRVRRLYLPESPPMITPRWKCRTCWHLLYRDPRRDYRRDALDRVDHLDALAADIARLRRITLEGLAELS